MLCIIYSFINCLFNRYTVNYISHGVIDGKPSVILLRRRSNHDMESGSVVTRCRNDAKPQWCEAPTKGSSFSGLLEQIREGWVRCSIYSLRCLWKYEAGRIHVRILAGMLVKECWWLMLVTVNKKCWGLGEFMLVFWEGCWWQTSRISKGCWWLLIRNDGSWENSCLFFERDAGDRHSK